MRGEKNRQRMAMRDSGAFSLRVGKKTLGSGFCTVDVTFNMMNLERKIDLLQFETWRCLNKNSFSHLRHMSFERDNCLGEIAETPLNWIGSV